MAKCRKCGKSGLFLRIDRRGLCSDCAEQRRNELYKLCNNPDHALVLNPSRNLTDQAVAEMVQSTVSNALRILRDCARIVESTANTETFYSRFDLLRHQLDYLGRFEKTDPTIFSQDRPSDIAPHFAAAASDAEVKMWKRKFDSVVEKIVDYKTDKGKQNAINKFSEEIALYESRMSPAAKESAAQLKNQLKKYL